MIRYFARLLRVHLGPGRAVYLLTLAGVALGVASVLCIQILNRNAIGAFAGTLEAISGQAHLTVLGRVGDVAGNISEDLLADVLAHPDVADAWPLHRVDVYLEEAGGPEAGGGSLEVLGFDLMHPRVLPWVDEDDAEDAADAIAAPGWVALTPAFAEMHGLAEGSTLAVYRGGRRAILKVGALVDFTKLSPLASRRLAVMDIAQSQSFFGTRGAISQIDVVLRDPSRAAAVAAELGARLGSAVRVVTPEQRTVEADGLLSAFRFNLTALSLISVLVGLFLVHSSTQASLVRRRAELGVLRCMGVSRARVVGLILAEVAVLGLGGVAMGLPIGYAVAKANVETVSTTLTLVYLLRAIETLELPPWIWLMAAGTGIGGALAGALLPALDVARRPPWALLAAYTLNERAVAWAPKLAGGGVAAIGVVSGWFFLAEGVGTKGVGRYSGFVLALCLLLSLAAMAPATIVAVCRRIRVRGFGLTYAARTLVSRLTTTAFAVISLSIAVSMVVGISIMIHSFRRSLEASITSTMRADVYVGNPGAGPGRGSTLEPAILEHLRARPDVAHLDRLRLTYVHMGERRISVSGVDMDLPDSEERFEFLAGDPRQALRRVASSEGILISEPLSRKGGLGVGDRLALPTPAGDVELEVAGVYSHYGSESGAALMGLEQFERLYGPGEPSAVAVYLRPGSDSEAVAEELRTRYADQNLRARSNRRFRGDILDVFDQTFAVTSLVQTMALLIAAVGIVMSLLLMARHRVAELALYRALGTARRQIFLLFVSKGVAMGLFGVFLGTTFGVMLAWILVHVINPAWFGWTLHMHWPWGGIALQLAIIVATAAAAAVYPALRASATPATELSRDNVT